MKLSPTNLDGKPDWSKGGVVALKHLADQGGRPDGPGQLPKGDLLLGYQASTLRLLFTGTALLVIEKSRRIGLTWGLAAYAVLRAAAQPSAGGIDAWYMGYDLEMAREFIETCAMWAEVFNLAADAVDEEVIEGEEAVKAFRIRFASGNKIVALPSVARALRGKQGLVIIDEAAFHKDLLEVLKAALALLMWGGQVVVVSTHDGALNPFNLLLDDIRAGRRKGDTLTITLNDALHAGLYERIALSAKLKGRDIAAFQEWVADLRASYGEDAAEELDCEPKEGSGSFLDPQDLSACEHPDAGKPELYSGGLYYLGRDVARRRDLAVLHGYELVGDVLWLRDRLLFKNTKFKIQDDAAAELIRTRRVTSYWIDQSGMGEKVVEDEQAKYGSTRCVGILFTGPSRLDLAMALKERVEACTIRVPPSPELRADWRAIKRKGTAGGGVSLVNATDEVHADEFWAAGLACRAASMGNAEYAYHSLRGRDLSGESALSRRRIENENPGSGFGGFRGFRY